MKVRSEHVGRPPGKLIDGDTAVAQTDNTMHGRVLIKDGKPFVQWADRLQPEPVRGMLLTMRRPGEVLSWER